MTRRNFLMSPAAPGLLGRVAAPHAGLRLGFDTYSLRAWGWKSGQLLDYAEQMGLDAIQLSGLNDFESLEPTFLAQTRARLQRSGLWPDAGTGCICRTSVAWGNRTDDPAAYLARAIDVGRAIGARSLRVFVGANADRFRSLPIEAHIESTLPVLRACRSRALDAGLKIAVENHGEFQAHELRTLIEEAGSDYVGACLDTGNPLHVLEDPRTTFEVLGPYTVTTHYRDGAVYPHPRGVAVQWTALGEGSVQLAEVVDLHRRHCPGAPFHLEIITGRPPLVFPCHEREFWKAYPRARAAEYARFLALAQSGQPFAGSMIVADVPGEKPPEYAAALRLQQKRDLERSLDYARRELGVGLRGRRIL